MAKDKEMTVERVLDDFTFAYDYKRKFLRFAEQDVEFSLGKQWDDEDVEVLKDRGVLPLTINKIDPILRLLRGLESQNRSDFKAYPEGEEDSLKSEVVTRLIKNAIKMDEGEYKISELFSDGAMCGEAWLEPYVDFSGSLMEGQFKIRKSDYFSFFWDPNAREYDLSDAQYLCKITYDLTRDQVLSLYPEAEDQLGDAPGKINLSGIAMDPNSLSVGVIRETKNYKDKDSNWSAVRQDAAAYDLLEYHYKRYVDHYYVIDQRSGAMKEADSKEEAENYVKVVNQRDPEGKDMASAIKKRVAEIWMMAIVGGTEKPLAHERAWSYPAWSGWPYIPFFAFRYSGHLTSDNRHLAVTGITRGIADLNRELNKRRTQELRHLNQSANSGWLTPENAWVDRDVVRDFGSTPGVNIEYKLEIGKPERMFPTPLSQGHAQLAAENSNDIKEASGINADLLASASGGQDSGRAIAIRQKQGLVMVQGLFDNLSRTKKRLGKFILSQLGEIYTVERAMKVVGEAFIAQNFSEPVMGPMIDPKTGRPAANPQTGQPILVPQVDPQTGRPVTQVNQNAAMEFFNQVLMDKDLGKYDVVVGEAVSQETVLLGNYMTLMDMAKQGIPVPPDVLIDESMISSSHKAKIKSAIERARMSAQQQPAKKE